MTVYIRQVQRRLEMGRATLWTRFNRGFCGWHGWGNKNRVFEQEVTEATERVRSLVNRAEREDVSLFVYIRIPHRPGHLLRERENGRVANNNSVFTVTGCLTAKAAEDCAHSRTLSRGWRIASAGDLARRWTAAGCQPAIQPINNRRYWAGAGAKGGGHQGGG